MLRETILAVFCVAGTVSGQLWETGDNSTISGCRHCSVDENAFECWKKTKAYFEGALVADVRHYTAVQIDIDQWYRRHKKEEGQNPDEVSQSIHEGLLANWRGDSDILTQDDIQKVADIIAERVIKISNRTISWVPHFMCPMPCNYIFNVYLMLFIVSMVLNGVLLAVLVPMACKYVKTRKSARRRIVQSVDDYEE